MRPPRDLSPLEKHDVSLSPQFGAYKAIIPSLMLGISGAWAREEIGALLQHLVSHVSCCGCQGRETNLAGVFCGVYMAWLSVKVSSVLGGVLTYGSCISALLVGYVARHLCALIKSPLVRCAMAIEFSTVSWRVAERVLLLR